MHETPLFFNSKQFLWTPFVQSLHLRKINFMVNQSKRWLQKVHASSMLGSFIVFSLFSCPLFAQEDYSSRAIYVVYDDSGSMYVDNEDTLKNAIPFNPIAISWLLIIFFKQKYLQTLSSLNSFLNQEFKW